MAEEKTQVPTPTPEVEPAPRAGGLGAGAEGRPSAGGAPTKCVEYEYRYNIKMPGRTEYILVDISKWEIVRPTREERSKTGAHGKDVYCLEESVWDKVVVVCLKRSNSGKLKYWVGSDNPALRETVAKEVEEILRTASDFEEMVESIRMYVKAKRLAQRGG